ncbi:MAG TPA: hypothetical protein VHI51_18100, partial [Ktedonobacterales bacterium]|nr:hypothetical protein [Ktedonobacterales bacterium]
GRGASGSPASAGAEGNGRAFGGLPVRSGGSIGAPHPSSSVAVVASHRAPAHAPGQAATRRAVSLRPSITVWRLFAH